MASSRPVSTSRLPTVARIQGIWQKWQQQRRWKLVFASIWLLLLGAATGSDLRLVRFWERQVQTLFFAMRGPVAAPEDIVILAIDDESLNQAEHYFADPEQFAELAPIQRFPWERRAYAIAIERILAAGARAVAVDLLFTSPSTYGPEDDAALAAVLERYGDRVVLAGTYGDSGPQQGMMLQASLPIDLLQQTPVHIGTINMLLDADNRIHQLGHKYLDTIARQHSDLDQGSQIENVVTSLESFAEATLRAAKLDYSPPKGPYIHFYGPHRSFDHLPFWYVLDADPWHNRLDAGAYFQDKIVLIGPTADSLQDFHPAPFSETLTYSSSTSGVEIQANAIATLLFNNALRDGITSPPIRGLLVVVIGGSFGALLWWVKRPIARLAWTTAVSSLWFGASFLLFTKGQVLVPAAMPIAGLVGVGSVYVVTDLLSEQIRKQRLRNTLAQYATSPIVQEIISQQDDLQDLIKVREAEVIGTILYARYRIIGLLGSGGFGETYTAEDTQRPGSPTCVVKQLKIISDDPSAHDLAHRLFTAEAVTLERLGNHSQIPRLLAYFEANYSFYLVEEMIEGHLLREEFASRKPMPQGYVLSLLQDILPVIGFVHQQGVIHRDIKPANIIRRQSDRRLVLIDFGAVKQISNQFTDTRAQVTSTIGIGTQGYMPSEQSAGMPGLYSDIYAIGITAVEALTGIPAYALKRDSKGELLWQHKVPKLLPQFEAILTNMVRYNFNERYSSAFDILADLDAIAPLIERESSNEPFDPLAVTSEDETDFEDADGATQMLPSNWQDPLKASEGNIPSDDSQQATQRSD